MGNRKAGRSKFTEYMIWAVLLLVIAVMTANIWVMQARAQHIRAGILQDRRVSGHNE